MKIKFDSDDNFPLNKMREILKVTIVVRAVSVKLINIFLQMNAYIKYKKLDISEEIDVNKISASKESNVCHYWYFVNYSFKFQLNVCNKYDFLMMSVNLSVIAILNIKGSDYCCIIRLISKNEATNLLQDADLTKKIGTLSI